MGNFLYTFLFQKRKDFFVSGNNVVDPEEEGCGDSGDRKYFVGRV